MLNIADYVNETQEGRKWIDVQNIVADILIDYNPDKEIEKILKQWRKVDREIRKYNAEHAAEENGEL
jgi:hypothetical protein